MPTRQGREPATKADPALIARLEALLNQPPRCTDCGRRLYAPQSIAQGRGPRCRAKRAVKQVSPHMFHPTAVYAEDLFGEPCIPSEESIPRRNSREYLEYIYSLTLPDELSFWSLSPEPAPKGAPSYVESIWCLDQQRQQQRILIDLRTGQRYDPARKGSLPPR